MVDMSCRVQADPKRIMSGPRRVLKAAMTCQIVTTFLSISMISRRDGALVMRAYVPQEYDRLFIMEPAARRPVRSELAECPALCKIHLMDGRVRI